MDEWQKDVFSKCVESIKDVVNTDDIGTTFNRQEVYVIMKALEKACNITQGPAATEREGG